jgi:hypothetical protein
MGFAILNDPASRPTSTMGSAEECGQAGSGPTHASPRTVAAEPPCVAAAASGGRLPLNGEGNRKEVAGIGGGCNYIFELGMPDTWAVGAWYVPCEGHVLIGEAAHRC